MGGISVVTCRTTYTAAVMLLIHIIICLPLLATTVPLLPDHRCQYFPSPRDLACSCTRSSLSIPSLPSLLSEWPNSRVESVSISHCGSVDLNLSTMGLTSPLHQVSVDTVDYLTLRGVDLSPT